MRTPVQKKETVEGLPSFDGSVVVAKLKLSEFLIVAAGDEGLDPKRNAARFPARLLASAVTDLEGRPLMSADDWDVASTDDDMREEVKRIRAVAERLNGVDGESEKNG